MSTRHKEGVICGKGSTSPQSIGGDRVELRVRESAEALSSTCRTALGQIYTTPPPVAFQVSTTHANGP